MSHYVVRNVLCNPPGAVVLLLGGTKLREGDEVAEELLLEHLTASAIEQLAHEGFLEKASD